jgi:TonB family protein
VFNTNGSHTYLSTPIPIEVTFCSSARQRTDQSPSPTASDKKTDLYDTIFKAAQVKKDIQAKEDAIVKKKEISKKIVKQNYQIQMGNNVQRTDIKPIKQYKTNEVEETKTVVSENSINGETFQPSDFKRLYAVAGSQYKRVSFDTNGFNYPYYEDQIKRKINRNWRWVESYGKLRALVYFRIYKNGSVSDISIKESSGNVEYDKNVLDTICRAVPFLDFPEDYRGESVGVFFEFKYK